MGFRGGGPALLMAYEEWTARVRAAYERARRAVDGLEFRIRPVQAEKQA